MPLTGIAIAGTVPVTFIEMLGLIDKVHVVDPKSVHSPCLQKLEEEGLIAAAGSGGDHAANWTKLITDHPTVTGVFTDSFSRAWKILLVFATSSLNHRVFNKIALVSYDVVSNICRSHCPSSRHRHAFRFDSSFLE